MACDDLSDRIRGRLESLSFMTEQKMFGGRAFMHRGNMLVCPTKDGSLIVRVGKNGLEAALAQPGAAIMNMAGRSMSGFVVVSGDALEDDERLFAWIDRARQFVDTLPAK